MPSADRKALLRSLRWLQSSGEYSDVKIFCRGQAFPAHKAILCPRSTFFAESCNAKWGTRESRGEIDLEEEDPRMVQLMLDYLYQLDYDDSLPMLDEADARTAEDESGPSHVAPLPTNSDFISPKTSGGPDTVSMVEPELVPDTLDSVARVAWDYGLSPKQKKRVEKEMKLAGTWANRITRDTIDEEAHSRHISDETSTSGQPNGAQSQDILEGNNSSTERLVVNVKLYILADKYCIQELKDLAIFKFQQAAKKDWRSEAFVRAADLAFDSTPDSDVGLRSAVISVMNEHRELTDYEEVQTLLDSGNGIAWQLLKLLLSAPEETTSQNCPKTNDYGI